MATALERTLGPHHAFPAVPTKMASPLVTLLINTPQVDRIPLLLESYGCQAWDMRFVVEKNSMDACKQACAVTVGHQVQTARCSCHMGGDADYAHRDILQQHADGKQGLVYTHADMWFDSRLHSRILKDPAALMLPGGKDMPRLLSVREQPIDAACIDTDKLKEQNNPDDDPYYWWDHSRRQCKEALNKTSISAFGKCCYDWTDLVYIPAEHQADFTALALNFSEVFGEVAIPTILNGLVWAGKGATKLDHLQCQGGPTTQVAWGELDRLCASRIPVENTAAARLHLACLPDNDLCRRDAKACKETWNATAAELAEAALELPAIEPSPAADESTSPYPSSYVHSWRCADVCDGMRCPDTKGWALEASVSFFPAECACSCSFFGHQKRAEAQACGGACPAGAVEGETLLAAKAAKAMMAHKAIKEVK